MEDLATRRLVVDDVAAWARLLREAEAVDDTGRHPSADDLAEDLGHDNLEASGVFDDGRLVAAGTVLPRGESEGEFQVLVAATVGPEQRGRGIGTALTRRLVDRAVELGARRRPDLPVRVSCMVRSGDTAREGC